MLPIARQLARALAGQHYLVKGPTTPAPSLLLVFSWGYLNPRIDDDPTDRDEPDAKIFWDQSDMQALVAGNTFKTLGAGFERQDIIEATRDDRYFVIVTAYDYAEFQQKKRKLLWMAKMSTPSNCGTLAEVIPALINSGAPYFGRETTRPQSVTAPIAREGKVEIGIPVVMPDTPEKAASPEKK
ncbi:MAG: hypothetical protein HZA31_11895 [Opitutae bacterium]|nr:hypothetical protein [Opitutae bacterium]